MAKGKDTDKPAKTKKIGRPSIYTEAMALRICEAIATCTDSYTKICEENPDFPSRKNMRLWRYKHELFRNMYDQAKRDQAELIVEEILEIADFTGLDTKINFKTGEKSMDSEWVGRSRLRIDTRKWIACKLIPKVYGEKPPDTPQGGVTSQEIKEIAQAIHELNSKHERDY